MLRDLQPTEPPEASLCTSLNSPNGRMFLITQIIFNFAAKLPSSHAVVTAAEFSLKLIQQ